jgi:acetolactate synthase small subunit
LFEGRTHPLVRPLGTPTLRRRLLEVNKKITIITTNNVVVLVRITSLLSRFSAKLKEIIVKEEKNSKLFIIKIILNGEEQTITRIKNLIEKQIDVVSVQV